MKRQVKAFSEFCNETKKSTIPIDEISINEFQSLLHKNCSQFLDVINNIDMKKPITSDLFDIEFLQKFFMLRKFQTDIGGFIFTDPKKSAVQRIAPHANWNWHNLIISNLESWRNYPRRNKSLISSQYNRASSHFGQYLYLVIPYDSTKIGVCPTSDFWMSFMSVTKIGNSDRELPSWFKVVIDKVSILNDTVLSPYQNDWDSLKSYLDKKYDASEWSGGESYPSIIKDYDESLTLLENLNKKLNPESNGFRLETFKNIPKIMTNNEFWFEDEGLLVKKNTLLKLSQKELNYLFKI